MEYSSVEEASKALEKAKNIVVGIRRLNVLFASPTSVIPHRERMKLKVSTFNTVKSYTSRVKRVFTPVC